MSEALRGFTLEEANGLVPRLTAEFGRISELRDQIASVARELGGATAAAELLEHQRRPRPEEIEPSERLRSLASEVNRTLHRVQQLGCVVKDVERGLVDFHSEVEGRHVFLCWQFGEAAIGHFHGLDEGFSERKPLEPIRGEPPVEPRWRN
jgi:hypothetical protein